jgi:hypothetical protein
MRGAAARLTVHTRNMETTSAATHENCSACRWRRLQPIRTASELELEFVVFTSEGFQFRRIGAEARTMRGLGMTLRAIGAALGVDEKMVRKALTSPAS